MFYNEDYYSNCSGVKLRKRKKKEKIEEDIISLNNKINAMLEEKIKQNKHTLQQIIQTFCVTKIPYGINKSDIENILRTHNQKNIKISNSQILSYKEYKDLIDKYHQIFSNDIENKFQIFKSSAKTIIDSYNIIINKPVKINFFTTTKVNDNQEEINKLKQEFIEMLHKCFPDLLKFEDTTYITSNLIYSTSNSKSQDQNKDDSCENCGSKNFIEELNSLVCQDCGMESKNIHLNSEFNDVERVNFSKKYTYKKYIHFRDTLKNFQGKQNRIIDEELILRLEKEMIRDGIIDISNNSNSRYDKVKKEHIRTYLDQIGENKHYENTNLIFAQITKLENHKITTELENMLMNDFSLFTHTFLELSAEDKSIQRTNILSSSYILFQLLRRHGYKCKEDDFSLPTSQKCRYEQEFIYSLCCEKLGWNFVSIL
jgi:hypothetical protein